MAALNHALSLDCDTEITVLHVVALDERDGSVRRTVLAEALDERREAADRTADRILAKARDRADDHGVTLKTATEYGHPPEEISDYAANHGIDRIVMGSHGRSGLSRLLLGSISEAVMRRSTVPVTTIRDSDGDEDGDDGTPSVQYDPLTHGTN